jgi:hypothetical protein
MRKARISSGPFFIVPQPRKKRIGLPEQKNISDADKKGCRIIASFS